MTACRLPVRITRNGKSGAFLMQALPWYTQPPINRDPLGGGETPLFAFFFASERGARNNRHLWFGQGQTLTDALAGQAVVAEKCK